MKYVEEKFSVDRNRLYAAGFENGARMAFTMAYRYPERFKGILAFGGGLGLGEPSSFIPVYQCVGDDDFNLTEVKRAKALLDSRHATTKLAVFHGGYEWPPKEFINQGLGWLVQMNP